MLNFVLLDNSFSDLFTEVQIRYQKTFKFGPGRCFIKIKSIPDIKIPRPKIRNIQKGRQLTHDIKIPGPKNCNIEKPKQLNHDIVIPRHFFRGQKATTSRFQYLKTSTSRFQDQKATTSSFCGILALIPPDTVCSKTLGVGHPATQSRAFAVGPTEKITLG